MQPDLKEFVAIVKMMRERQLEYFRTRDKIVMLACKELERKVDTQIGEIENAK